MLRRDISAYSIIKIGKNTENTPRDLTRLAVTETPVQDHQLKLEKKKHSQKTRPYNSQQKKNEN